MINYKDCVHPFSKNFIKVAVPKKKRDKIKEFIVELVKEKRKENHHKVDPMNELKRHYTGYLGEAAVEEYLKIKIINWEIGYSRQFAYPDIKEKKVGIKTVEYGKFPVIYKKNYYPQIINIRGNSKVVYICGIASVDILNSFQSKELILSPYLRKRGVKTGFYGFNKLEKISKFN